MRQVSQQNQGVFHTKKSALNYDLKLYPPTNGLANIVDTYWFVQWDLPRTAPHIQRNLPSPNMHLVFDQQVRYCTGIMTHAYETPLIGRGGLCGVKFHIGILEYLLPSHSKELHNLHFSTEFLLLPDNLKVNYQHHSASINSLNEALSHLKQPSPQQKRVQFAWLQLLQNPDIHSVEEWAQLSHISVRTLQRLCLKFIGLTPKWLLRKQRCINALQLLDSKDMDLHDVIILLGLTDQAHLIREFKTVLGLTPNQYLKL